MKRVLLAICFCVFVSSIANAQCAWVFWDRASNNLFDKEGKWELKKAFPTYNECLEFLDSQLQSTREMFEADAKENPTLKVRVNPKDSVIVLNSKNPEKSIYFEYRCFPDTIDPRK